MTAPVPPPAFINSLSMGTDLAQPQPTGIGSGCVGMMPDSDVPPTDMEAAEATAALWTSLSHAAARVALARMAAENGMRAEFGTGLDVAGEIHHG